MGGCYIYWNIYLRRIPWWLCSYHELLVKEEYICSINQKIIPGYHSRKLFYFVKKSFPTIFSLRIRFRLEIHSKFYEDSFLRNIRELYYSHLRLAFDLMTALMIFWNFYRISPLKNYKDFYSYFLNLLYSWIWF